MSEQFPDPEKTTMQSVAGAGRAFSEQSAAMDAARRQAEVEKQKALLQYDMAERTREQNAIAEAAKAERERTSMSAENYGNVLSRRLDAIDRIIDSKMKAITDDTLASPDLERPLKKKSKNLTEAANKWRGCSSLSGNRLMARSPLIPTISARASPPSRTTYGSNCICP
jgi:hypothetical protein